MHSRSKKKFLLVSIIFISVFIGEVCYCWAGKGLRNNEEAFKEFNSLQRDINQDRIGKNFGFLLSSVLNFVKPQLTLSLEKQQGLKVTVNGWTGPAIAGVKELIWNWGDGKQEKGFFSKSHIYLKDGVYRIKVTSVGLFAKTTEELEVTVQEKPQKPSLQIAVQSIKGDKVTINGFVKDATKIIWDWGDGTKGESWFPASHTYDSYSDYIITVTAKNQNVSTVKELRVAVKEPIKPILQIALQSMEGDKVTINGFVKDATKIIWNWGDGTKGESWFPASHIYSEDGSYEILAKAINANLSTSKHFLIEVPFKEELITEKGEYTIFLDFPKRFFDQSFISERQILNVLDAQYLSLRALHSGDSPYDLTKIEYDPLVYAATTPEGIKLGDSAFPVMNAGDPRWEVMAHEQGHNFFGGTSVFYGSLAFGHPFLQESLAVLSAFYTYHNILDSQQKFSIDSNTVNSLKADFGNGRTYQENQYELYISEGKNFNIDDVLTSQALSYKMIKYGEQYGWHNYINLVKLFGDEIADRFDFHKDGVSAIEQSTYAIAALSVSFAKDFTGEFKELKFPIDKSLYRKAYSEISNYLQEENKKITKKDFGEEIETQSEKELKNNKFVTTLKQWTQSVFSRLINFFR